MNFQALIDALVSHAQATGLFETTNGHQPDSIPATGITCGIWVQEIRPVAALSGLAATSVSVILNVRLYTSAVQQPLDAIDPQMVGAVSTLCAAYTADFELGGLAFDIDLLGAYGTSMSVVAGYIQQSGVTLRVMTITLPLVLDDVWTQVA